MLHIRNINSQLHGRADDTTLIVLWTLNKRLAQFMVPKERLIGKSHHLAHGWQPYRLARRPCVE
jgi:hypothetical protein